MTEEKGRGEKASLQRDRCNDGWRHFCGPSFIHLVLKRQLMITCCLIREEQAVTHL